MLTDSSLFTSSLGKAAQRFLASALMLGLAACAGRSSTPDKTLAGAVLGAGWGAGAGAIVGHQIHDNAGPGAAVGAGMGAVAGALTGYSQDTASDSQGKLQDDLSALQIQNMANRNELSAIQTKLDRAISNGASAAIYQVFFGEDETDLRAGAVAELQMIADSLKRNPGAYRIAVNGHSDDAGTPSYNARISEARARTVSAYLGARGIGMDQITVNGFGSTRPLAPNTTPEGRQLNRRVEIFVSR